MAFGKFQLFPERRLLLYDGQPVKIGGRAMSLLIALVSQAGTAITRDELTELLWPSTKVVPGSLRVQIAGLQKVLGDDEYGKRYIVNISGEGYQFTAPVTRTAVADPAMYEHIDSSISGLGREPGPATRTYGRERDVQAVIDQLSAGPLVTIVGPGGMGKTTVALRVMERVGSTYAFGARFIGLGTVSNAELVAAATASAMGLASGAKNVEAALLHFLEDKEALIVLDNCEHLLDYLPSFCERIRRVAPSVSILATSREPLRSEGERLVHLPALEVPRGDEAADGLLQVPSVALFLDRARASDPGLEATVENLAIIANLCRRLEGAPMSIELVAAQVGFFGLRGLEASLDERLILAAEGRRTALPRQQSVRSTLDWSYALLSPMQKTIFNRLSVFRGPFSTCQASAIVIDAKVDANQAMVGLIALAERSMICRMAVPGGEEFHQSSVSRFYAAEKLSESGEEGMMLKRHAEGMLELFDRTKEDWTTLPRSQWVAALGPKLNDIRAALAWAFSPNGDSSLGIKMTAAWIPIGINLSLVDEFALWLAEAERSVAAGADVGSATRFNLLLARVWLEGIFMGALPGLAGSLRDAMKRTALKEESGLEVEAQIALFIADFAAGRYLKAFETAMDMLQLAKVDPRPSIRLTVERMHAQVLHYLGKLDEASAICERIRPPGTASASLIVGTLCQVDLRVSIRLLQARTLFIQGAFDTAVELADEALLLAEDDIPLAVPQVLSQASVPFAIWRGECERALALSTRMIEYAHEYRMPVYSVWGENYRLVSLWHLAEGREPLPEFNLYHDVQVDHLSTMCEHLASAELAKRADMGEVGWCAPEILRARAKNLMSEDLLSQADFMLRKAIAKADEQGALLWKLRIATTLSQLLRRRGRKDEGRRLLTEILSLVKEGHRSADVVSARSELAYT